MTELGTQILRLLEQRRLVTPRILQEWFAKTPNQIKAELRRLRRDELIDSHPFVGKQVYYRLTDSACRKANVSRRLSGPLGPQALRRDFGLLHFAAACQPPRRFVNEPQWRKLAQRLGEKNANKPPSRQLYLDYEPTRSEKPFLIGLALVDGRTEPASLLRKPAAFVSQYRDDALLRKLITAEDFLFAFITESQGKAESLANAYPAAIIPGPIRLHVCSDLAFL